MKKKALVFDFDGTLVDSFKLENDSMLYAINSNSCNTNVTEENITSYYGPTEKGIINQFVDVPYQEKAFNDFLYFYEKEAYKYKLFPRLEKLLFKLKLNNSIQLFLITGRGKQSLDISLKVNNLTNFFIKEYTGSDTGINKEESIETLIHDYGLNKEEILYLGDTIADINSMNKAGVEILSCGYSHDREYQDRLNVLNNGKVVSSIAQLEEFLNYYIN